MTEPLPDPILAVLEAARAVDNLPLGLDLGDRGYRRAALPIWTVLSELPDGTDRKWTRIAAESADHARSFVPNRVIIDLSPEPAVPASPQSAKMSDCTSRLGTVCKDPACPLHFPHNAEQPEPSDAEQPGPYAALPDTLTHGLTVWGDYGGAQLRIESDLCTCDQPDLHLAPDDSAAGVLYIHHRDDAPRSTEEDGAPWRLTGDEARALRDLLNIATARGVL